MSRESTRVTEASNQFMHYIIKPVENVPESFLVTLEVNKVCSHYLTSSSKKEWRIFPLERSPRLSRILTGN